MSQRATHTRFSTSGVDQGKAKDGLFSFLVSSLTGRRQMWWCESAQANSGSYSSLWSSPVWSSKSRRLLPVFHGTEHKCSGVRSIRKQRMKWSVEDEATLCVAAQLTSFKPCPICSQNKLNSFLTGQFRRRCRSLTDATRGTDLNTAFCFSLASFPRRDPEGRVYFAHPPQRPVKTFKTADNTLTWRELLLLIRHSKWLLPGPGPAMNGRSRIYRVACPLCCIKSDQLWVSLMVATH